MEVGVHGAPEGVVGAVLGTEPLEVAVIEGKNLVLRRLLEEQRPQFFELVRVVFGEVLGLREILVEVVELPLVLVERVFGGLAPADPRQSFRRGVGHPAVVVDALVGDHLEILGAMVFVGVGAVERRKQARTVEGHLFDTADDRGHRQVRRRQDGRDDVGDMGELRTQPTGVLDARRPRHHHRGAGAAQMRGDLLVPLIGRVHRMRPAVGEVVLEPPAAEVVDVLDHEVFAVVDPIAEGDDLAGHSTTGRILGAGPVIALDVDDQGVVELAEFLDRIDQAPYLMIAVRQRRGVALHLPGTYPFHVRRQVIPTFVVFGGRVECGIGWDHPDLLLLLIGHLPLAVPAVVELALELVDPLLRGMVGSVRSARRVVRQERLVGVDRLLGPDPADRLVGHVGVQVIGVLTPQIRVDRQGVLIHCGTELMRVGAEEPVEVLESQP